jgi:hypothetical protein
VPTHANSANAPTTAKTVAAVFQPSDPSPGIALITTRLVVCNASPQEKIPKYSLLSRDVLLLNESNRFRMDQTAAESKLLERRSSELKPNHSFEPRSASGREHIDDPVGLIVVLAELTEDHSGDAAHLLHQRGHWPLFGQAMV